jgi:hypothetical protein
MKLRFILAFILLLTLGAFAQVLGPILMSGPVATSSAGYTVPAFTSQANGGGSTTAVTPSFSVSAGDALIATAIWCDNSSCTAATGTTLSGVAGIGGDTFTCPSGSYGDGFTSGQGCYVCSSVGGTSTYTGTFSFVVSTAAYYAEIVVARVTGVKPSSCLDTGTPNTLNGVYTNPSVSTLGAVAQSGEFCFGSGTGNANTMVPNQTVIQDSTQWTLGTTGTQTLSWTAGSQHVDAFIMCLEHP